MVFLSRFILSSLVCSSSLSDDLVVKLRGGGGLRGALDRPGVVTSTTSSWRYPSPSLHKLLTASLVPYRIKLGVRNKQMRKSSELYFIFIFPLYELLSIKIDSSIEVALIWVSSLIFLLDSSRPYLGQLFNIGVLLAPLQIHVSKAKKPD